MTTARRAFSALAIALVALSAGACSGATAPDPAATPGDTMSPMEPALVVSSPDFSDGDYLAERNSANAWGQCSGDNLNPALEWSGAPDGTAAYAIVLLDRSAGNWVHWVHANIPASVTSVAVGGSGALPGVEGRNNAGEAGYFGPCPPGPDHRYEFQVWALDAPLDLPAEPTFPDLVGAAEGHVLARGSIVGLWSPRADD